MTIFSSPSSGPAERQPTVIPRFTIRTLLAVLTVCAFLFVIVGLAFRGQHWAWGVTIGLASLSVTALVHAAWFGLVQLLARLQQQPPQEAAPRRLDG
jgi:hypothetical protein